MAIGFSTNLLLFNSFLFWAEGQTRHLSDRFVTKETNRDLLVHGTDTEPGEYPWHVRVGCCSGALIAPDIVLSAGHVLPPPDAVSVMKLYVGAYETDTTGLNDGAESFAVQQAWLHPNYTTIHDDFALFLLDGTASNVDPVRLNGDNSVPEPGSDVTLLGTGTFSLETANRPTVLQSAITQTLSNEDCRLAYDPKRGISYGGGFVGPTNLCTFSDRDGCDFDSGGPIVYEDHYEGDILVGLISFGVDCADPVYPAVNARVSAVKDWIAGIVCQYSQAPPADLRCQERSPPVEESRESVTEMAAELVAPLSTDDRRFISHSVLVVSALVVFSVIGLLVIAKTGPAKRAPPSETFPSNKELITGGERQRLLSAKQ